MGKYLDYRSKEDRNGELTVLRGFAKKKNPRLLWNWVGGSRSLGIFFWKIYFSMGSNFFWIFGFFLTLQRP